MLQEKAKREANKTEKKIEVGEAAIENYAKSVSVLTEELDAAQNSYDESTGNVARLWREWVIYKTFSVMPHGDRDLQLDIAVTLAEVAKITTTRKQLEVTMNEVLEKHRVKESVTEEDQAETETVVVIEPEKEVVSEVAAAPVVPSTESPAPKKRGRPVGWKKKETNTSVEIVDTPATEETDKEADFEFVMDEAANG